MSLEEFLGTDAIAIAAAYHLLNWAKMTASYRQPEKEKKYEDLQQAVEEMAVKYVTSDDIIRAACDLATESPDDEVLMERADKLVARKN